MVRARRDLGITEYNPYSTAEKTEAQKAAAWQGRGDLGPDPVLFKPHVLVINSKFIVHLLEPRMCETEIQ